MIPTILTYNKTPKLTLVGAGPGDPELITLKGVNALKNADVVLFDALVSKEILDLIPEGVPSFSVGKRAGAHSYSQDEINELIVELAYLYGNVVRLKGGDPFVFGRGSEEVDFAHRHGIHTEVVPGISSAIAVPAAIGIPLTQRGISESFWVVTGTTKAGAISNDIKLAAQSSATIIILMGISKIGEIMETFRQHNKTNVPVAVVQNGTMSNQKHVIGTVDSITNLMSNEDIHSPGIIVIGEVVNNANEMIKVLNEKVITNYE